ncbi:MAG: hypothetical protein ACTS3F_03000 [Phycisphaerales bacterium]
MAILIHTKNALSLPLVWAKLIASDADRRTLLFDRHGSDLTQAHQHHPPRAAPEHRDVSSLSAPLTTEAACTEIRSIVPGRVRLSDRTPPNPHDKFQIADDRARAWRPAAVFAVAGVSRRFRGCVAVVAGIRA